MTYPRRNQYDQLVPELSDWMRGWQEAERLEQDEGITLDRDRVDYAALGRSLADTEPPLEPEELAELVAQQQAKNEVRRRVLDGGPVTQAELDADRDYFRVYTLPEGCIVHWDDGQHTIVAKGPDGRLVHRLLLDQQHTAGQPTPEVTGPGGRPDDAAVSDSVGLDQGQLDTAGAEQSQIHDRYAKIKEKALSEKSDREQFEDEE